MSETNEIHIGNNENGNGPASITSATEFSTDVITLNHKNSSFSPRLAGSIDKAPSRLAASLLSTRIFLLFLSSRVGK